MPDEFFHASIMFTNEMEAYFKEEGLKPTRVEHVSGAG